MNITISNAGNETLTNFPAYINLTYDSDMQSNFIDIRFYSEYCDNGGARLDYEIENYITSNRAHIWVRIPSLPSSGTIISVYYKNNTAVSSGENATGVWDSYYKGVWHMTELNATDSTSNNNDGNESGGVTYNPSGKIDGADGFDGANDYVDVGNDSSLNITDALTMEAWIKFDTVHSGGIISKGNYNTYGPYGMHLSTSSTQTIQFAVGDGDAATSRNNFYSNTIDIDNNSWHHVAVAFSDSDNEAKFYIDGALDVTRSVTVSLGTNTKNVVIGATQGSSSPSNFFNGSIDEVLISNTNRSANWINQSYLIVTNQTDYVSFGGEQTPTVSVQVKTYTLGLVEKDIFKPNDIVRIRAWVACSLGREYLSNSTVLIKNNLGSTVVNKELMTNISEITKGYIYEYNYTIPSDAESLWSIKVTAADSFGRENYDSKKIAIIPLTFQVKVVLNSTSDKIYIPGTGERTFSGLTTTEYSTPDHYYIASYSNDVLKSVVSSYMIPLSIFTEKGSGIYGIGT
ncbi:MAG: LamG domain-containing protein, partial [Candidatus Aenigmarchaeota archaeon]